MKKIIRFISFLAALVLCVCASAGEAVSVIALQGPTGIGMVNLMENRSDLYNITMTAAPDEAVAAILSGSADIAAVPTNLAATLYSKTNGNIRMLALNTLGVLYILENGNAIQDISDLSGKTVYATGQSATPEYVLNYVLNAEGLTESVRVEYLAEHAELATRMASGNVEVAMLPEPFVTSVLLKNPDVRVALDMTEMYRGAAESPDENGVLSMGCVIASANFVQEHPETVREFLNDYRESVEFVNSDPHAASLLVEKFGIMAAAAAAEKAIPNCHIVCITGNEMKEQIRPFFDVLYRADPKSVGGKLPEDDLYYTDGE